MTTKLRILAMVMVILLPQASPALPRSATAALSDQPVTFSPTNAKLIRLVSSRTRSRSDQPTMSQKMESTDELIFERNAEGYLLKWTGRSIKVEAPGPMKPILERVYAGTLNKPMLIQLDDSGMPVRVLNLGEIRALVDTAIATLLTGFDELFATVPEPGQSAIKKLIGNIAASQRGLTDAQLESQLLDDPQMLFGLGRVPLRSGFGVPFEVETSVPPFDLPIKSIGQIRVLNVDAGKSATISVSSAASPKSVGEATNALLKRMLEGVVPTNQETVIAEIAKLDAVAVTDELIVELSLVDGIPIKLDYVKAVSIPGQPTTRETKSYRRE